MSTMDGRERTARSRRRWGEGRVARNGSGRRESRRAWIGALPSDVPPAPQATPGRGGERVGAVAQSNDGWAPSRIRELSAVAWTVTLRTYFLILGTVLFLAFIYTARDAVRTLMLAAVIAAGTGPWAFRLNRIALPPNGWRIPVAAGVLLLYLGTVLVFVLVGALVVPPVVGQAQDLARNAPTYAQQAQANVDILVARYPWLPALELRADQITQLVGQLVGTIQAGLPAVLSIVLSVLGGIIEAVLTLTIALYLVLEGKTLQGAFLKLLPGGQRRQAREVIDEIADKTGQWLMGQLTLSLAIFGVTLGGLLLIGIPFGGVPYTFLLAVIAGILEMVPVVGPLMAAVVAVSVSAFKSPLLALVVALFYLLVQQLENNLLVPKIMGHAVGISPLTVITALAVGGSLAGVFGAILAVPVAAALQVLIGAVLRGDVDPSVEENGQVSVTVREQLVTE